MLHLVVLLFLVHINNYTSFSDALDIHNSSTSSTNFGLFSKHGAPLCPYYRQPKDPKCPLTECYWREGEGRVVNSNKVVLLYSHNGLGNQLFQNSFALSVAGALEAELYNTQLPHSLSVRGHYPPNTNDAFELLSKTISSKYLYDHLPLNSSLRQLCENEPFYVTDRPYEVKRGFVNRDAQGKMEALLRDIEPRCIRIVGFG